MVMKGRIITTEQKAKSIKGDVEKLVTKAKKDEVAAKRLLQPYLKPHEVEKMIAEIAPSFKSRQGGYTRIIKTGRRFNDDASMVILEWVEREEIVVSPKEEKKVVKVKKEDKNEKKVVKKTVKKEKK